MSSTAANTLAKAEMSTSAMFHPFKGEVAGIALPERFTYPFAYEPHALATLAAEELQAYLGEQRDFEHNFGLSEAQEGLEIGKMFGVLVVRNAEGQLGYLRGFSGKLAGSNEVAGFVPPVFDMLTPNSFFLEEEEQINALNRELDRLQARPDLAAAKAELATVLEAEALELNEAKALMKAAKKERKAQRKAAEATMGPEELQALEAELNKQSIGAKVRFKYVTLGWKEQVAAAKAKLNVLEDELLRIKEERKTRSAALQAQLFDQYTFLNAQGEAEGLGALFRNTPYVSPPAAAGECAAPKLMQYAYQNALEPIALAEFWWGASHKAEIRKHKHYYPACQGKCGPILGHMLQGLEVDPNPLLINPGEGKEIAMVYEDEHMAVIHKPADLLSVPGKTIVDSVAWRMKQLFPEADGPLIVHRLDMSTSGLMLIAKTQEIHKYLQRQFIKRSVKKRYIALLDGVVEADGGIIDLPLRTDFHDRPRQMVCYEHGKASRTQWEKLEVREGKTLVHFHPITGRTHQLRMHAAHDSGLNTPIVGDDLYGTRANRLHLHAEWIEFMHPVTMERMQFQVDAEFA